MRQLILVATILVLTSCQWAQPTADMMEAEYRAGIIDGCITTMYVLAGPPPSDDALLAGVQLCQAIADEIQADSMPLELPTTVPGSTL